MFLNIFSKASNLFYNCENPYHNEMIDFNFERIVIWTIIFAIIGFITTIITGYKYLKLFGKIIEYIYEFIKMKIKQSKN